MANRPIDVAELVAEVANANFEDERLNKRLKALVEGLARDPGKSLPRSFDSAGLEAAYRFFSNVHVTPEEILSGHFGATSKRCAAEGDFLMVHDTTTFLYRYDGEREGLGRVKRLSPGLGANPRKIPLPRRSILLARHAQQSCPLLQRRLRSRDRNLGLTIPIRHRP
jgi:hypothetical protein